MGDKSSMNKYASPAEAFTSHVNSCTVCRESLYGLCAVGFRILGAVARMRQASGTMELLPSEQTNKPLVKAAIRQIQRQTNL